MIALDSIDEKLVRLLGKNAQQSYEQLAKQLNISAATVRRRLRKLIQNNLLSIVGVVDPSDFGLPLGAVITIDVVHDKLESTLEELSKQPEIRWVATTTGRYDVIIGGRFRSLDSLSDFTLKVLGKMKGVRSSETFIQLKHIKGGQVRLLDS